VSCDHVRLPFDETTIRIVWSGEWRGIGTISVSQITQAAQHSQFRGSVASARSNTAAIANRLKASIRAVILVWASYFEGEFKLGNDRYCDPLTVIDHASRFLLRCEGLVSRPGLSSL
jgi:hypothetical protein